MKFLKNLSLVGLMALAFTSCEDVIDVDLDEGTPQLAVDAFITDQMETQQVVLSVTTPYFDNLTQNRVETATVFINDDNGNRVDFQHTQDGVYTWTPDSTSTFITSGGSYTLTVETSTETYTAQTTANPVPPIDSLVYEFREESFGEDEGFYAAFYARDFAGTDDYYWIRTFRNDTLDDDPARLNVSANAAFAGDGADGLTFILPIREFITDASNPYKQGDRVRVELWAISERTFSFLQEVGTQLRNDGLFATPASNVSTNMVNANPASDVTAVGWFSVASVEVAEVAIE